MSAPYSVLTRLRFTREEAGSALLEMAVCLSGFVVLLFGMMDCARAIYVDLYVDYAARAAAHYAMVRGSTFAGTGCATTSTPNCMATTANITSFVQSIAPPGVTTTANALTVASTWPATTVTGDPCVTTAGNNSPNCVVHVRVNYTFNFIFPFLPAGNRTFQSNSTMTIAQ